MGSEPPPPRDWNFYEKIFWTPPKNRKCMRKKNPDPPRKISGYAPDRDDKEWLGIFTRSVNLQKTWQKWSFAYYVTPKNCNFYLLPLSVINYVRKLKKLIWNVSITWTPSFKRIVICKRPGAYSWGTKKFENPSKMKEKNSWRGVPGLQNVQKMLANWRKFSRGEGHGPPRAPPWLRPWWG